MTESDLVAQILLAYGARDGLRIWRVNVGVARDQRGAVVRFGLRGMADIQGVLAPSGRHVSIECKSAIGRQTKEQSAWQRMIESLGGIYILARTVEDVAATLGPLLATPSPSPSLAASVPP